MPPTEPMMCIGGVVSDERTVCERSLRRKGGQDEKGRGGTSSEGGHKLTKL